MLSIFEYLGTAGAWGVEARAGLAHNLYTRSAMSTGVHSLMWHCVTLYI